MHCSMMDKNLSCQLRQASSTLFPELEIGGPMQSVSSIKSEAFAKSAWEYFHIDLLAERLGGFLFLMASEIPL